MLLGTIKKSIKVIKVIIKALKIVTIVLLVLVILLFFTGSNYIKVKNDGAVINTAKDGVIEPISGVNTRATGYSAGDVPSTGPVTIGDKTYYKYYQWNEAYLNVPYGTGTVYKSGCGPVSISMILSGVLDQQITPESFLKNVEEKYPNSSYYYSYKDGSLYDGIFTSEFLEEYYGVKSVKLNLDVDKAIEYLDNGHPVIASIGYSEGGGHILALVPPSEEEKSQGYKFYVLDSINCSDGPYTSVQDYKDRNVSSYEKGSIAEFNVRYAIVKE